MADVIRILIVDDQRRARQSLSAVLASNFKAVELCEAESGEEALRLAEECWPRVVVMDAHMPGLDGIEATRRLKAAWPRAHVIVLSLYPEYEGPALAAGADTFVSKGEPPERLLGAVTAAVQAGAEQEANDAAPL
jgi:DNA-binding NarL/FixJ family response regulator